MKQFYKLHTDDIITLCGQSWQIVCSLYLILRRYKMKPIDKPEKICRITGKTEGLHKHHVFGAANRKLSEKYNLYVYLAPECHNMSNNGVHFNKKFDGELKREYQMKFELVNGAGSFIQVFGRNYLEVA